MPLKEYCVTRDEAYSMFLNMKSSSRLVKVSRYLPDGATVPVVLEVIKFKLC